MKPVSILMPAWNARRFIGEAIHSVLEQDYKNFELIIVDDGSEDDTLSIVLNMKMNDDRIHVISTPHRGVSASRNEALIAARGDFITFLDADDLWSANRLRKHMDFIDKEAECDLFFGSVHIFRDDLFCLSSNGEQIDSVFAPNLGAGTINRRVFDSVGIFDTTLSASEDIDFLMRCHERGLNFVVKDFVSLYHRRHGGNMSNDSEMNRKMLLQVLARSAVRRRSENNSAPLSPFPLAIPNHLDRYVPMRIENDE